MKANTGKTSALAERLQLPFWRLEDGFISYLGHPALGDRRFSLIVDKTGIYYDARQPSDLENLLNNPQWLTPELEARSVKLIDTICTHTRLILMVATVYTAVLTTVLITSTL